MATARTYRSKAVVLDSVKLGETDLIVTMLAESGRQLRAVAKGGRKPGSRLAARVQPFCTVDALLARGRNLDVFSQAELVGAPLGAQPSYEQLCAASAIAEVAKMCCFEEADDPFVFAITTRALEVAGSLSSGCRDCRASAPESVRPDVSEGAQLDIVVAAYILKVLSHVGYRPDFSACVACGDKDVSFFSASAGGLLCASCAASIAGAQRIGSREVGWLRSLLALRFDELASCSVDFATSFRMVELAHLWAATHLDCRLRAVEFLLGR